MEDLEERGDEKENKKFITQKIAIQKQREEQQKAKITKLHTLNLTQKWTYLTSEVGGCTRGEQYCFSHDCKGTSCFDRDSLWQIFLKQDKKSLSNFLILQLPDTTRTIVHTCPYMMATKGEVSTYCLQKIHKRNWYDLDKKYSKYTDGTLQIGKDYYSKQDELQKELKTKNSVDLLTTKWKEIILNSK